MRKVVFSAALSIGLLLLASVAALADGIPSGW